jgi:hypothetical protein
MDGRWGCMDRANEVISDAGKHTFYGQRLSEGQHDVLTLEHLLLVDGRFSLNTLLQSTTSPQLFNGVVREQSTA